MYEIEIMPGVKAKADVTNCSVVKGSFSYNAASDLDYWGYTELEYFLCDMDGNRDESLEALAEANDAWDRIDDQILTQMDEY